MNKIRLTLLIFALLQGLHGYLSAQPKSSAFSVQLDPSAGKPLSGRLYIFSNTDTTRGVGDPDPFNPSPTFFLDVVNWIPGETKIVDNKANAYPVKMGNLKPGYYKFAAVFDTDTLERNNTLAPGNWYSRDVVVHITENGFDMAPILLNRKVTERPFKETALIRNESFRTQMLSGFRKRDCFIKAAVVLPKNYDSLKTTAYPVVFIIPGWGGTHFDALSPAMQNRYGMGMGLEKIYVYLNPETSNPYGLHAFIDSRVNGPWGRALVEEFIPYLTGKYRIEKNKELHFVAGQSSGGYAALWLQLNYPKEFGGCWAVSPDPVDFSDFTSVNLYEKGGNFYYDQTNKIRPFFEMNGQYLGTIMGFSKFEDFLGNGGQLQSFEAVFGILDKKTGKPAQIFNRNTGIIDASIVEQWKPYDMSLFIENNYNKLKESISGKIHVYAGAQDNFFLNRSVRLFKQKVKKLNMFQATVEEIEGANHWTIWNEGFTKRVQQEIDKRIVLGRP